MTRAIFVAGVRFPFLFLDNNLRMQRIASSLIDTQQCPKTKNVDVYDFIPCANTLLNSTNKGYIQKSMKLKDTSKSCMNDVGAENCNISRKRV